MLPKVSNFLSIFNEVINTVRVPITEQMTGKIPQESKRYIILKLRQKFPNLSRNTMPKDSVGRFSDRHKTRIVDGCQGVLPLQEQGGDQEVLEY